MKRRDRVLQALQALARGRLQDNGQDAGDSILGLFTSEIAVRAGIARSNCSGELNELCRSGHVRKLLGRPTRYWPVDVQLPESFDQENLARTPDTLLHSVMQSPKVRDAFSHLVGSSRSLREVVRQAKIAVSYPPHGMHSLILGQAGVGKTTLASAMHAYAIEKGMLARKAPFVPFNCAEYANNPEILMDHLFGHVRGAFTGANHDKLGLIESAHEGLLFLDEIHRLPPQGQEMLFHWLDSGHFRRMGEVEAKRHSHALLVAATTEVEETALLLTFRRRIPVTIHLPALWEWSLHDRYELIYHGVREEAETLGRAICVSGAAVDKLLFAHFPGNIGGLRNALKLACARAWALDEEPHSELHIEPQHVQLADSERITLVSSGAFAKAKEIHVKPKDASPPVSAVIFEESLYGQLARLGEQLQEIGLAHDEIVIALERELLRRQLKQQPIAPSQEELRRFVGDPFFAWLKTSWATVAQRIDDNTAERAFIRVSMHLSGLTRDGQEHGPTVDESVFAHVRKEYPDLCEIAQTLLSSFARESGIELPAHEVPLVALLIKPITQERIAKVGVVLMMRGDGISTQLAQTVQQVSLSANIVSINVPLGAGQTWIDEQTARSLQLADNGLGLIVMTDLPTVRRWLGEHAQDVVCVYRPDLTTVLETVLAIESGVDVAKCGSAPTGQLAQRTTGGVAGKRRIWACCLTGRGTAMALKRLLENTLSAQLLEQIEIVPVEVSPEGIVANAPAGAVMAVVGSVRPRVTGAPFLSVEELLAPQGMERLQNIISHVQANDAPEQTAAAAESLPKRDVLDYAQSMLEQDVRLVNPYLAMRAAEQAVEALAAACGRSFDLAWRARFALHMAYAVERAVLQTPLRHAHVSLLQADFPELWRQVEQALAAYQQLFAIDCAPDEIAYVCDMVRMLDTEYHEESGS